MIRIGLVIALLGLTLAAPALAQDEIVVTGTKRAGTEPQQVTGVGIKRRARRPFVAESARAKYDVRRSWG